MIVRGNGKLLLSGEYLVLEGAEALALPTKLGQELSYDTNSVEQIDWLSFERSTCFLDASFDLNGDVLKGSGKEVETLSHILKSILKLQKRKTLPSMKLSSAIEFNRQWGLGSSSSLIYCLSQIFAIDPYDLLKLTFGGSGYDIACAEANEAIIYQLKDDKAHWRKKAFKPEFSDKIHFVYLNKKMNSREALKNFESKKHKVSQNDIDFISSISNKLSECQSVAEFSNLVEQHESHLSHLLEMPTVKSELFSDYTGAIKSLGAWGGDFVLALGDAGEMQYFRNKGFTTILSYNDIALTTETK